MDKLLNPDIGLLITTIVTFLLLVFILKSTAWKHVINGLTQREEKIKSDLERAEKAQSQAEALRLKYETQLAEAQKSIQEMVSKARAEGEQTRAQIITEAKDESGRILEKGKKELEGQAEMLKQELKNEVAELTLAISEKVLTKSADKAVVDEAVRESIKNMEGVTQ